VAPTALVTIDVKNVFYVFYFSHVFNVFLTFFIFAYVFIIKNVGKKTPGFSETSYNELIN